MHLLLVLVIFSRYYSIVLLTLATLVILLYSLVESRSEIFFSFAYHFQSCLEDWNTPSDLIEVIASLSTIQVTSSWDVFPFKPMHHFIC